MDTFDYITLRSKTVDPLIAKFGKIASLKVYDFPTGAPYESQVDSETSYPVKVVQITLKKYDNSAALVEVDDIGFLLSTQGLTIDPALADGIVVDGVRYQVISINPLKPGDVNMLWKIIARK